MNNDIGMIVVSSNKIVSSCWLIQKC